MLNDLDEIEIKMANQTTGPVMIEVYNYESLQFD
mgnify:CR=1 FL=1